MGRSLRRLTWKTNSHTSKPDWFRAVHDVASFPHTGETRMKSCIRCEVSLRRKPAFGIGSRGRAGRKE